MKTIKFYPGLLARTSLAAACVLVLVAPNAFAVGPQLPLQISSIPLFVANPVNPNVLVILDDSESMDGTMAGKLISPADLTTRGNIGRSVMRNTITNFEYAFNWGLMSYETSGVNQFNTYPYFMGDSTTMILTDNCNPVPPAAVVDNNDPGISPDNGQNCIPNPTPFAGAGFVTYAISSDDPDINDVLYTGAGNPTIWATAAGGTNYNLFNTRIPTTPTLWANANFSNPTFGFNPVGFTPTDSGFLPSNLTVPAVTRQFYYHRAVGYLGSVNGLGELVEPIVFEGAPLQTHFNLLMTAMGNSTTTLGTPELKNAAVSTPLAGTLETAAKYFSGTLGGGHPSPVQFACQKNFVMLITDGLPTARPNGSIYPFPVGVTAVNDTIAPIKCLSGLDTTCDVKVPPLTGPAPDGSFPIPTYILGLGDTVANANAVGFMNSFAVNGLTTQAYLANDPQTFQDAIAAIVQDIVQQVGAASAVSLNAGTFQTGAAVYQATFNTIGWFGQVFDTSLNPDGSLGSQVWEASSILNATPPTTRTILTLKPSAAQGSQGIPFRWPANPAAPTATEMDPSQIADLNMNGGGAVDNFGAQRLAWMRGSRANECDPSGVCFGGASGPPFFRLRNSSFLLGDIIDSAPNYVASPAFFYPDSMEAVPYSTFVQANLHRQPMLYVGANDGMLHGFNATNGLESLAYVPSAFYKIGSLNQLMLFNYSHHYYVDGTPTIGDAFFGGAWHTVLVGGFGAGGQGIYALDITNPGAFAEGNAASTVLWEYDDTNDGAPDPDTMDATTKFGLGLTFGKPIIVKMNNNRWAAVFGNGYNNTNADGAQNANGYAMLYIVDLQTGQLIRKINTQMARDVNGSPNGLNTPAAIDTNGDSKADFIYAGDLLGNIWKFDVSSPNPAAWKVAFTSGGLPAPFVRNTRANQAMTEDMEIGKPANGALSGYMVYFGTGSYFTIPDETSIATQTFYAIYDPNDGATDYTIGVNPATAGLLQQSVIGTPTVGANTFRVFSNSYPGQDNAFLSTYKGWYIDLPSLGERQVTTPVLENGKVIFTTTIPDNTPCDAGGKSWLFDLDAYSGNALSFPVFDVNGDGNIDRNDVVPSGVGTAFPGALEAQGVLSSPGIMGMGANTPQGQKHLETKYLSQSNGSSAGGASNTLDRVLEQSGSGASGRISWQQLK